MSCQLNLYHTDETFKKNSLYYDCVNYHIYHETLAYQELSDVVDEVIPFCFRPVDDFDETIKASVGPLSLKLSFEEIRVTGITAIQLLSWSVPLEIAERYQFYLNEPNSAFNEYFYNCTERRFGLLCQYSFAFGEGMSFNQIVEASFHERKPYSESLNMMVPVACYVLLECHRNGQFWCLDWREVCDGNVDCFDEGLDEQFCFDMEVNECSEDEYRCHNGLCISQDLWEDGLGDTDCLDRSDKIINIAYIGACFQDPTFRCEEHSCRVGENVSFSCGDGQCVSKFAECHNGRHVLLIDSMSAKGNLTEECWVAMICLTKLIRKDNGNLCDLLIMNGTVNEFLKKCDSVVQFPTIPVYSDHIRFLYVNPHLKLDEDQLLLPDHFCYDQRFCDSIEPDVVHNNLTCLNKTGLTMIWNMDTYIWIELMTRIEEDFSSCMIYRNTLSNEINYSNYPSLYKCQNSRKFISKHRILDNILDCFEEDDEAYEDSCQLNDRYRVICHDKTKCWSPLVKMEACRMNGLYDSTGISFQSFCDGIEQYFYDNNGQKHSDELGCEDWLCDNIYTRCDGFLVCSDGRDEDNCGQAICPSQTYPCIHPTNYTIFCLPYASVNDGTADCLGALDEQVYCRSSYSRTEVSYPFHCSKNRRCLPVSQLCDKNIDCEEADDEKFCKTQQVACDQNSAHKRSNVDEVVCALNELENRKTRYFSVHTSSNYPVLEKSAAVEVNYGVTKHHSIMNGKMSQLKDNLWAWYCKRGLLVHSWIQNNSNIRICMCPPSYYGYLCQYQNQRIGLTLRLTSNDRYATYAIVSMLIGEVDEKQEIDAYDQFGYIVKQSASIKLNRYLLFSMRPKNASKNYSVRIDTFEKNTITYIGSWYFPIAFIFLPVNRLSISLNLSDHLIQRSTNCSITCKNGECVKYFNKNKYFCRCFPRWSGIQCNIPLDCETCSSDSICIESSNNQSICVCPIGRSGPRCLFISTCSTNACQNNGRCIPGDVTTYGKKYTCLCSENFFGPNCEHRKAKIDIFLIDIDIPLYFVGYFFTLSNKSKPIETTIIQKLTYLQLMVTFRIAVPFHFLFIQVNDRYYLAALLQQSPKNDMSTSISPKQECTSVKQLLNDTVLNMIPYQRIIHFHLLCYTRFELNCFVDKNYICLCTSDHHANCMTFNRERNFQCPSNNYCANGGKCLQDHPISLSPKTCLCPECFSGNRCQFNTRSIGATLNEILGYEFKRNTVLSEQLITVKTSATVTILISVIGIINSILSIITLSRKKSLEVGCGIYLLASSTVSLLTILLYALNFWLLFFSHQNLYGQRHQQNLFRGSCYIASLLKVFLYLNNWLYACVAIERTVSAMQGINFNKKHSKRVARWIIPLLFAIIVCLFIPQLIHLYIFNDDTEERTWCTVTYTPWLQIYNTIWILFHYCAPLFINVFSAVLVIITTAQQRAHTQTDRSFGIHFQLKLKEQKHILISPAIITCLTLPYLIISITLNCKESSDLLWYYLTGYFLSFLPAAFVFIIFILPSSLYKQEFQHLIIYIRRRFEIFRLSIFRL